MWAVADKYDVLKSTLQCLVNGGIPMSAFNASKQWLTPAEERIVVDFSLESANQGFPLTVTNVYKCADNILTAIGPEFCAYSQFIYQRGLNSRPASHISSVNECKEAKSPTLSHCPKRSDNRRDTSSANQGYIWCVRSILTLSPTLENSA